MLQRCLILVAALATAVPSFVEASPQAERQAVPRGSRPQGDNPRTGTAVPRTPRQDAPPPPRTTGPTTRGGDRDRADDENGRRTIITTRPPVNYSRYDYPYYPYYPYSPYYPYYPQRLYPYGYGAFGLGYFYYDPYGWFPGGYTTSMRPGSYPQTGWSFDIGELRLEVSPRNAEVFVNESYAGLVDDFDGAFQALKLQPGTYLLRISSPGYEDLMFDVRIAPGQKINYRGDLRRWR